MTALGAPVSTAEVITTSIMGAGSARRRSSVRWGVARKIIAAVCGARNAAARRTHRSDHTALFWHNLWQCCTGRPEIPANTGNIGRTCVVAELICI